VLINSEWSGEATKLMQSTLSQWSLM